MLNSCIFHGRFKQDPELKNTSNGVSYVSFAIAVERSYKDANKEKMVDFINCVAWRGLAETISKYFAKGDQIIVTGSLETRNYVDKDGNKRYSFTINVNGFDFCGGKKNNSAVPVTDSPSANNTFANNSGFSELNDLDGKELPF